MSNKLLSHYYQELSALRSEGITFAQQHPAQAEQLQLNAEGSSDPDVAYLFEAFAFMSARLRMDLQAEQLQFSEKLLAHLCPQFLQSPPACTIAEFVPGEDAGKEAVIAAGTMLSTAARLGPACLFQSVYEVNVLPWRINHCQWHANQLRVDLLRLGQDSPNAVGDASGNRDPVFFINMPEHAFELYALLQTHCQSITVTDKQGMQVSLPVQALQMRGLADADGLFAVCQQGLSAYRLLLDYLVLPEKFLFFQINGLTNIIHKADGQEITLKFNFAASQVNLSDFMQANSLVLNAAPVINLYQQTSEPVTINFKQEAYTLTALNKVDNQAAHIQKVLNIKATNELGERLATQEFFLTEALQTQDNAYLAWQFQQDGKLVVDANAELSGQLDNVIVRAEVLCDDGERAAHFAYQTPYQALNFHEHDEKAVGDVQTVMPMRYQRISVHDNSHLDIIKFLSGKRHGFTEVADPKQALLDFINCFQHFNAPVIAAIKQAIVAVQTEMDVVRIVEGRVSAFMPAVQYRLTVDSQAFIKQQGLLFASVWREFLLKNLSNQSALAFTLVDKSQGVIKSWPAKRGDNNVL